MRWIHFWHCPIFVATVFTPHILHRAVARWRTTNGESSWRSRMNRSAMVSGMAETVHLDLKANGNVIHGESTQRRSGARELDRVPGLQATTCARRGSWARARRSAGGSMSRSRSSSGSTRRRRCWRRRCARTRRSRGPSSSTGPSPKGDGSTEQFFTIDLRDGRIDAIERHSPNAIDPAESKAPPLETVRFVYHTIRWSTCRRARNMRIAGVSPTPEPRRR
jgi:type VI secretion system secreted protein Hcp